MAKVGITELAIRDAHQSLLATRMTTADMLPACGMLNKIGYKFVEGWGGATYDSCIRFLNEDPWDRLRKLHAAMPDTKIMMLLRAQNLLGYRHYADDVVEKFVEELMSLEFLIAAMILEIWNVPQKLQKKLESTFKWLFPMQLLLITLLKNMQSLQKLMQISVLIQFA